MATMARRRTIQEQEPKRSKRTNKSPLCSTATKILTNNALRLISHLSNKFKDQRRSLLSARQSHSMEYESGVPMKAASDDNNEVGVEMSEYE